MFSLFLTKRREKKVKPSRVSKTPQLSRQQHSSNVHTAHTSGKKYKKANRKKAKKVPRRMLRVATSTGRLDAQQLCGVWGNI